MTAAQIVLDIDTHSKQDSILLLLTETSMRTTQQLSMTLPSEMAEAVKLMVQGGEYASESEVIRDGLRALLARDRAVERWLHGEVATAFDVLKADPARAITAAQLRRRLAGEHGKSQ